MQQIRQSKAVQLVVTLFLVLLVLYIAGVFFLYSRPEGFHGFLSSMSKEAIVSLRTALAGLAIFTFFPLIWTVHRRSDEKNSSRLMAWSVLALALAQSPCVFGLILFLLKGAFKTFFAFFALSAFYMLIGWPREVDEGR